MNPFRIRIGCVLCQQSYCFLAENEPITCRRATCMHCFEADDYFCPRNKPFLILQLIQLTPHHHTSLLKDIIYQFPRGKQRAQKCPQFRFMRNEHPHKSSFLLFIHD